MHNQNKSADPKRDTVLKNWVDAYSSSLYRRALYLTSNAAVAEDIVQETFLAATQYFDNYTAASAPGTWLHAILKNKVADYFRGRYRSDPPKQDEGDSDDSFFTPEGRWREEAIPAEWDNTPEHLLDDPAFTRVLEDCLNHLQPQWRDVLVAKFLTDKKGPDICQEFHINPTNFWQILHRAKLRVRHCLEQYWFQT